ncbi:MAG TPA: rod shape-determining protein MreC [Crocinitomicaceae bacterium]|nr:rod shape-determining protein MreC [Crocinitomicaceae bacterium]
MRNFIAFIKHFQVLLIFALLQGIALSFYFSFVQFPRSQYLTTAGAVQGSILSIRNDLTKHFNLEENNTLLQKQNIELLKKNPQSFIPQENGLVKINDTLQRLQYEYIPAVVINSTYDKRDNYFTINIGSNQGIKRGMGVFSTKGVVGIIHNTSSNFAVIKSCLTQKLNIAIVIDKTTEFGFLEWKGLDARRGTMTGVSNDFELKKWTKIITRGGGGVFPRGIPVGKIESFDVIEGEPLWDITLLFEENFKSIQNVYVIKNLLLEEQKSLEEEVQDQP